MADIKQAAKWWDAEIVPTRKAWGANNALIKWNGHFTRRDSAIKRLWPLSSEDILADDWEIAQ